MKKFNLTLEIEGAADAEEITIILDRIKRGINGGRTGENVVFDCRFKWELETETETEPETVNA